MAKRGSDQVGFLLIDGFDVLGLTTVISDDREALTEDVTALGDAWARTEYAKIRRGEISQDGFYDDAANKTNDALVSKEGTSRVLVYGLEGNTIGRDFIGFSGAMQVNYVRTTTRGELHKANARYLNNGVVEDGVILHDHVEETADGDTEDSAAAQVWQVDDTPSGNAFVDETTDFNSVAADDVDPFPAVEAIGDYIAVGHVNTFHRLTINTGTVGVGGVVAWEYRKSDNTWAALTGVTDGTTGFTVSGSQDLTFTVPTDWIKFSLNGSASLFYIRARVTTVYSTNPILTQGFIGTSINNGASSANGGAGYLEVSALALNGATSFDVTIEDSADDLTFANLITFTVVTAAPAAERVTVTGTVDQYVSAKWVSTGGGPVTVTFMTGFVRNP